MSQSLVQKVTDKIPADVLYYASSVYVMKGYCSDEKLIKDKGISSATEYVEIRIPVEFLDHVFKEV